MDDDAARAPDAALIRLQRSRHRRYDWRDHDFLINGMLSILAKSDLSKNYQTTSGPA